MAQILVIDDDDQFRVMLKQMLTRNGYEVLEAPNGHEGLKLYREKKPELVITDIIMPEKEGIELIIELKREYPEVKVIAMSGGGRVKPDSYLDTAKILGAIRTFQKPFSMKDLLKTVESELK